MSLSGIAAFFSTKKSIRAKIFTAFSLVILFSLIMVTAVMYYNSSGSIKQNAIAYVQESMRHAGDSLRLMLEDMDSINAVVVTNRPNIIDPLQTELSPLSYEAYYEKKQTEQFLASLIAYKSSVSWIAVAGIGPNAKFYYAGTPWLNRTVLEDGLIEQIVKADGKRLYVKYENKAEPGQPHLIVGRGIKFRGKTVGVSMINVNYEMIENAYGIQPLKDSGMYVVQDDGTFIFGTDEDVARRPIRETALADAYERLQTGATAAEDAEMSGQAYWIVGSRSDYTGWTTIALVSHESVTHNLAKLRNELVQLVLLVFAVVLLVSIAVASRITKDMKKLSNAMLRVKKGNLAATTSITSQDEVGQLHEVFKEMMSRLKSLMSDMKERELQKREAELSALQAQVSPHFLYNTMNTIKYLARLQDARNIEEVSTSLVELMRGVLGNTKEFVTVGEELHYIRSFVLIQKYKYIHPFTVHIQIEPELERCKIPKLLLQPIVENAILHGLSPREGDGRIVIKIQQADSRLHIEITDNGVGMTEEQIRGALEAHKSGNGGSFSHIGISNVKERIQLLFGEPFRLDIDSQPGMYTRVEIVIPQLAG